MNFAKFVIPGIGSIFVEVFFLFAMKILVTFAIFAAFSRPFLAFSLSKSRILLTFLFVLFLRYLLPCLFRLQGYLLLLLRFLRNLRNLRRSRGPSLPFFLYKSRILLNLLFLLYLR